MKFKPVIVTTTEKPVVKEEKVKIVKDKKNNSTYGKNALNNNNIFIKDDCKINHQGLFNILEKYENTTYVCNKYVKREISVGLEEFNNTNENLKVKNEDGSYKVVNSGKAVLYRIIKEYNIGDTAPLGIMSSIQFYKSDVPVVIDNNFATVKTPNVLFKQNERLTYVYVILQILNELPDNLKPTFDSTRIDNSPIFISGVDNKLYPRVYNHYIKISRNNAPETVDIEVTEEVYNTLDVTEKTIKKTKKGENKFYKVVPNDGSVVEVVNNSTFNFGSNKLKELMEDFIKVEVNEQTDHVSAIEGFKLEKDEILNDGFIGLGEVEQSDDVYFAEFLNFKYKESVQS